MRDDCDKKITYRNVVVEEKEYPQDQSKGESNSDPLRIE